MPLDPLDLDVSRPYQVTLSGRPDQPSLAGVFSGLETFETLLLPGDDLAAVATLDARWDPSVPDNPTGRDNPIVLVPFVGPTLAIAGVQPGIYRVRGLVNPASDRLPFLDDTIELRPAPTAATAPPRVYCTREDLIDLVGTIEGSLDLTKDQTGFAEKRALARRWTVRILMSRAEDRLLEQVRAHGAAYAASYVPASGVDYGPEWGPSIYSDTAVQAQLNAIRAALDDDRLVVDDDLRTMNAYYAISLILTPALGGDAGPYGTNQQQKLGLLYRNTANSMMAGWSGRIDVDGDGIAEVKL